MTRFPSGEDRLLDGPKIIVAGIVLVISVLLTVGMYGVVNHYSLPTLGTVVAHRLMPSEGPGLGNGLLVEIGIDIASWFAVLSGLLWLIGKLRSPK